MPELDLQERRKKASEESLGQSHQVIYETFLKVIGDKKLSGKLLDFGAGQGSLCSLIHQTHQFEKVMGTDLMARPASLSEEIDERERLARKLTCLSRLPHAV